MICTYSFILSFRSSTRSLALDSTSRFFSISRSQASMDRAFFDGVAKKLDIKNWEDWYKIREPELDKVSTSIKNLINSSYQSSIYYALSNLYPEHPWRIFKFRRFVYPKDYFKNIDNRRVYLNIIGNYLNINNWEDWYCIEQKKFEDNGGDRLLRFYPSLMECLMSLLNEFPWDPWYFIDKPLSYWKNEDNQKLFLDRLASQLGVIQFKDWNRIKRSIILQHRGEGLLKVHKGSLIAALEANYPEHPWRNNDANV